MNRVSAFLKRDGILAAIFVFLLVFPFVVGALTDSSPTGVARGDRMIMRGESVRWQAVLIEMFILSLLAMSYNLLFGFTGVISFGHALFFGMSGYVFGLMLEYTALDNGVATLLGVVLGIALSGLLGLGIGLATLRLKGVYFAIFTLALAEMVFIFFSRLQLTKAEDGFAISQLPAWLDPSQSRLTFYYITLALFVLGYLFLRRLMASPTGAVFKAIRENEDRAQSIGFNTLRFKLLSLVVAGMMAGAAGILQVMLNKKVGPELLSLSYTIDPLLMTIIGGAGTLMGPVIGASSLHLLDVFLRDKVVAVAGITINFANIWGLLLGAIFIIVVMVFPNGIVGTYQRWRARRAVAASGVAPAARPARKPTG
ncbi:MAG TPA: branched-chain amino acid ABC transporter permease [Candidatus Limnocylindrales bacterium]|nr:branched-chain amino acid ABC transporter permease [Candidatus Limnocylindrales bacterium]